MKPRHVILNNGRPWDKLESSKNFPKIVKILFGFRALKSLVKEDSEAIVTLDNKNLLLAQDRSHALPTRNRSVMLVCNVEN